MYHIEFGDGDEFLFTTKTPWKWGCEEFFIPQHGGGCVTGNEVENQELGQGVYSRISQIVAIPKFNQCIIIDLSVNNLN